MSLYRKFHWEEAGHRTDVAEEQRLFVLGNRKGRRDRNPLQHTHARIQKQSNHKLRVIALRAGLSWSEGGFLH